MKTRRFIRAVILAFFFLLLFSVLLQLIPKQTWNLWYFERTIIWLQPTEKPVANIETTEKEGTLQEMIATIIGAVVAAFFGMATAWWQARRSAITEFKIFISIKNGEIDSAENALSFFKDTLLDIRDEIHRVSPFLLTNAKRRTLQRLWNEYKQSEQRLTGAHDFAHKTISGVDQKTRFEHPSAALHKFMDDFLKVVSDW